MKYAFSTVILAALIQMSWAQEVRAYLDLQMHPTMHDIYPFFSKGFTFFEPEKPPKLSFSHQFKNVNYANFYQQNPGVRIIVAGSLTTEGIKNRKKARRVILRQLEYVNNFAEEHSDQFVVAKSPQEVRALLQEGTKTIIVHSIEGGKRLIGSQADADFWADQGVAFITLIHLVDSELGASAIKPGIFTKLINLKGTLANQKKRVGLTEEGRNAILYLAKAGVMTDLAHMADKTRADALDFMESQGIPPIVTHDLFRPIQNHPRGLKPEQIIRIYKNGGFIGLPISGQSLKPYKSTDFYGRLLDSLKQEKAYCEGSVDAFKLTYTEVKDLVESSYQSINPEWVEFESFNALPEKEKVKLSIGFQSDFNGWVSHSGPKYGKKGCYSIDPDRVYEEIELQGLPHAGLLESQWRWLEKEGVDLAPIQRNAERFLQLWEAFRIRAAEGVDLK